MSVELRCSVRTRARGDVPVATATSAATHVLVETPLPWPRDLAATELHRAVAAAAGPGARVHGVVPCSGSPAGDLTVVVHTAPPGPFAGYRRRSTTSPPERVPEAVGALREEPGSEDDDVDLLVCGHGARDRCCGSMGTALAGRTAAVRDVRVWRSSHLGGHRFAPTALHLPTGTAWAWLDDDLLAAVVDRSRPPAELRGNYRGSAAVGHPAAQVVEAEAFAQVGWAWLDGPRDAVVRAETVAGRGWDVEVVGAGRRWQAVVAKVGEVPQPVCGEPGPGAKSDPVWRITSLEESASS